jgi:hypothetical protein
MRCPRAWRVSELSPFEYFTGSSEEFRRFDTLPASSAEDGHGSPSMSHSWTLAKASCLAEPNKRLDGTKSGSARSTYLKAYARGHCWYDETCVQLRYGRPVMDIASSDADDRDDL